jgi:hypothetical protein
MTIVINFIFLLQQYGHGEESIAEYCKMYTTYCVINQRDGSEQIKDEKAYT